MYQNFFQFTRRAFAAAPDSALLYVTPVVERTLQGLEQTLRQGEGIGLLTAPAGVGKTLICQAVRDRLACHWPLCEEINGEPGGVEDISGQSETPNGPVPVLLLQPQFPTRSSLLQAVLFELKRPYARMSEQELRLELISFGRELAQAHQGIAIIVDEAHLLGEHILEELRGLTNYMYCTEPIFRVVLSGQLALEETLTSRSMEAVNQRLSCHASLETLTRQESVEYIETRINGCGANCCDIFTPEALELIVHASDGLPRCLNQLCDHTCLLASLSGSKPAEESHVREALDDLVKLPLHWNVPQPRLDPVSELKESNHACENCDSCENNCCASDDESTIEISPVETPVVETTSVPQLQSQEELSGELESSGVFEIGGPVSPEPDNSITEDISDEVQARNEYEEVEAGFDEVAFEHGQIELESDVEEPVNELAPAALTEIPEEITEEVDTTVKSESQKLESALEEFIEKEFVESEVEYITPAQRQELAESLLDGVGVPDNSVPEEEVICSEEQWEEEVQDRYATLDARRLGQLTEVASIEPGPQEQDVTDSVQNDLEHSIGQSVLELTTELAAAIGEADGDIVPNPDDIIVTANESFADNEAEAEYDVVEPE